MPIRTNHNGVLFLATAAIAVFMSLGMAEPVSAAPASTTKKVASTSATKGVRTKTAYQTRRSGKATTKKTVKKSLVKKAYAAPAIKESSVAGDSNAVARAKSLIGSRYRWGGESRSTGFDCSGLIKYVFGGKADNLPRTSAGMYSAVTKTSDLQPGDIVFFGRGRVRHSALYVGNGQVVHASTPRSGVRMDSVHTLAKALGYMGSGRI